MRRALRLRAHQDFRRVRSTGRAWSHPLVVLLAAPGPDPAGATRVGISVGRRVGKAVKRNRVKRRLREAVRARYGELPAGWDVVVIARPPAAAAPYAALADAVYLLLGRSGLLSAAP